MSEMQFFSLDKWREARIIFFDHQLEVAVSVLHKAAKRRRWPCVAQPSSVHA
jgi:hypothetical protein